MIQGNRVRVVFDCFYTGNTGTVDWMDLLTNSVGVEMDSGRYQIWSSYQLEVIDE